MFWGRKANHLEYVNEHPLGFPSFFCLYKWGASQNELTTPHTFNKIHYLNDFLITIAISLIYCFYPQQLTISAFNKHLNAYGSNPDIWSLTTVEDDRHPSRVTRGHSERVVVCAVLLLTSYLENTRHRWQLKWFPRRHYRWCRWEYMALGCPILSSSVNTVRRGRGGPAPPPLPCHLNPLSLPPWRYTPVSVTPCCDVFGVLAWWRLGTLLLRMISGLASWSLRLLITAVTEENPGSECKHAQLFRFSEDELCPKL